MTPLSERRLDQRHEPHGLKLDVLDAACPAADHQPLLAVGDRHDEPADRRQLLLARRWHAASRGGGDGDRGVGRRVGVALRAVADESLPI